MLGKCLKYDFKETFKLWWVGALVSLLSALPLSLLIFSIMNDIGDQSSFRWQVFPLMICYIGVVVGMMISLFSVYVRYYRHFFGKEAYLTFTLPVKRTTLFTSKYITALFFNIASYAILIFGMAGFMGYAILDTAGSGFSGSAERESLVTMVIVALIVIVVYALFFLYTISLSTLSYFFIITFCGVYFKKYSLLAIIVAFFCLSFFGSYAMMLPMMGGMLGIFGLVGLIDANIVSMGPLQGFALIGAGLLLVIVAVTALNMLLAFLSKELLERKLNVT
ncbi:MAG: hypothetical protein IJZ33_02680 [Clostridia bacterium]|nr:hypothetical protein [Clostridia bacterium]